MQSVGSTEATALMRIPASFLNLNAEEDDEAECHSWFGSTHRLLVLDGIQVQEASYLFSWYGYATFNSFQLLNTGPWQSRYFTEVSDGFWLGKEDTMRKIETWHLCFNSAHFFYASTSCDLPSLSSNLNES